MKDRHLSCSICSQIPDKSNTFYRGGRRQGDGSGDIPAVAGELEIVGAPFFKDIMNRSRTVLKKCPQCGTYYEWKYVYEFLIPESEDDVTLTRISDEDGKEWEARVFATIRASEERFREQAKEALQVLADDATHKELANALRIFSYASSVQGHDIAFALPALLAAMSSLSMLVNSMQVLFHKPSDDPEQARLILDTISDREEVKAYAPAIKRVIEECEKTLAGKDEEESSST